MRSFIAGNSAMYMKNFMKSLMKNFMKAPYGLVEDDREGVVAKLLEDGDISLPLKLYCDTGVAFLTIDINCKITIEPNKIAKISYWKLIAVFPSKRPNPSRTIGDKN